MHVIRRRARLAGGACLALLLLSAFAHAAPLEQTLPSGLRLVVERQAAAPVAAVRLYVHTGSVYEGLWTGSGVSHLLEHTVFRGSARYTEAQTRDAIAALGEAVNAYTAQGVTCYYCTTTADRTLTALDLLADLVLAPTLSDEAVAQEQQVIAREIQQGEDEPARVISKLLFATLFTVHPQGQPIVGFVPALAALTPADARAYHRARYAPQNVVAVLVGDFDPAPVQQQAAAVLSAYPARGTAPRPLPAEPPLLAPRREVRAQPGLQRAHAILAWRGVSLFSADMYPLDLLAAVLGQGDSSRLVSRLVHETSLADSVWCGNDTPDYDAGTLQVGLVCAPEKLDLALAGVLGEVGRVREQGVTLAELDRARGKLRAAKVFAEQTAVSRAESLGLNLLLTGDAEFTDRYLARLAQVTPAQVREAARRYLDPQVYALAVVRPPETETGPAPEPTGATRPRRGSLVTLPNGLRVVVSPQPGSGAVQVVAAVRAGLRLEPPGQAGLSNFCAQMLTRGVPGFSRATLARKLEDRGATLEPFSGRNTLGLEGQALAEDAEFLLARAADCLRRPDFPPAEISALRELTLAQISSQQESPDFVASLLLGEMLFGDHPYRGPESGTAETVAALTREQLLAFHAAVCGPAQTVLVLSGDLPTARARELAERYFGDWRPGGTPPAPPPPPQPLAQGATRTEQRPQAQALIYLGWLGPRVDSPNRVVWEVLQAALNSQDSGGPLYPPLRDAGLVYGAGAYFTPGLDPGSAILYAATDPGKVEPTQRMLEAALRGLQQEPLAPEVLDRVRESLVTQYELGLAEPLARAQAQALDELYGLGYDRVLKYAEEVRGVSAEQVQELAREALPLDRAAVVITTPPATGE